MLIYFTICGMNAAKCQPGFKKVDFVFDYVVLNLRYSLLQPVSNTDRLAQDFFLTVFVCLVVTLLIFLKFIKSAILITK